MNLQPCKRVGIEITWRCNLHCRHCFHLRNKNFHKLIDTPFKDIQDEITNARQRGCNHTVVVGQGEPTLDKRLPDILKYSQDMGLETSIITNGTAPIKLYEKLYRDGLDHLHLSMHGTGQIFDKIVRVERMHRRQNQLVAWLKESKLPWRNNMTIQKHNYEDIPNVINMAMDGGIFHFVFLVFMPIYDWPNYMGDVAVHPKKLQPIIQKGIDDLRDTYLSLRYFPMCYLEPKYWKYVANSWSVFYDPWEWEYGKLDLAHPENTWKAAMERRSSVRHPYCEQYCKAYNHCGGWFKGYADYLGYKNVLRAITKIPDEYKGVWDTPGGVFMMNPANQLKGTICQHTKR